MKKSDRKFVFTNALYVFLWVCFGLMCFKVFLFATVEISEYGTPLYENGVWDILKAIGVLLLALSFKKEESED